MRKTDRQRARELRFRKSARSGWTWRADRPYKGVRIEIMGTCEHEDRWPQRRVPHTTRYYFCLRRVGAPNLGPASSTRDVFLNSTSGYVGGGMYTTRSLARDMAIRAIDDGYPKLP